MNAEYARFAGLGTRVAARTFAMFCVCAIVPIVLSATLADRMVSSKLQEQAASQLTQVSKSYGLLVFERLRQTDEVLAELATLAIGEQLPLQELRSFTSSRFRIVDVADNVVVGTALHAAARATHDEDDHQVSLMLHRIAGRTEVRLAVTKIQGSRQLTLTAALQESYLWDAEAVHLSSTRICIDGPDAATLSCVGELPDADGAKPGRMLLGKWQLYLPPRYDVAPWLVRTWQPASIAFSTLDSFKRTLPIVTLIAIAVALLLSTLQIRRSHRPLALLTEAAKRIGRTHFEQRVQIDTKDEYRRLGNAFNRMSLGLARQFALFRTLERIDSMILHDPSTDTLMDRILPSLPRLLRSPLAAVAVASQDARQIAIYVSSAGMPVSRLHIQGRQIQSLIGAIDPDVSALTGLDEQLASQPLFGVPIEVDGALRGALLLAGKRARIGIRARHAGAFAHRFAVALGSEQRREALFRQAYYDELTGLPNRQLLKDRLQREITRSKRTQARFAVFYIDLDRFKNVNDSMGHSAGDELLCAVSSRLASEVREGDTLARLGGDEFVVIATALDAYPTHVLAERLQACLGEPIGMRGASHVMQASLGVAIYPQDGADAEVLLRNADTAMYRAKAAGRGRVAYFEDEMNREVQRRLLIEQRLRTALRERTLMLSYQPKVSLVDGSLAGVEALARWTDSQLGMVSPTVFIAVAEECGLIEELGSWALQEACATYQRLRLAGVELGHVSVNVSIRQLRERGFLQKVRNALERCGMNAQALEIEVTESTLADNPQLVIAALDELRLMGVRVAIDDFGTGYSSMSSLAVLPTDVLKIDRSFVMDCGTHQTSRSVIEAIVSMAHVLGKVTVAEGVETQAQLQTLRQLGCDFAQGHVFAMPMPVHQLACIADEAARWRDILGGRDAAKATVLA
jgi:diguanylate cyclase (GGDEF)-like protein